MPREIVRLPRHADASSVPDWWPGVFATRQRKIRARITKLLAQNGRLAKSALIDRCRSSYDIQEVKHALDAMEREGTLSREDVVEGVGYQKACIMTISYFSMVEDKPGVGDGA